MYIDYDSLFTRILMPYSRILINYFSLFPGDPIADSFGVSARKNNALLIVADGVNWGEKSKMAARCAVYGCMKFMNEKLFTAGKSIKTTHVCMTTRF